MATTRPSRMPTSARRAGAPVPSITVPPRTTTSKAGAVGIGPSTARGYLTPASGILAADGTPTADRRHRPADRPPRRRPGHVLPPEDRRRDRRVRHPEATDHRDVEQDPALGRALRRDRHPVNPTLRRARRRRLRRLDRRRARRRRPRDHPHRRRGRHVRGGARGRRPVRGDLRRRLRRDRRRRARSCSARLDEARRVAATSACSARTRTSTRSRLPRRPRRAGDRARSPSRATRAGRCSRARSSASA